jgi:hypothetical protein
VGSKVISTTTSTIELASSNTITLNTALAASFFNLTLSASKSLNMTAGVLFTINGNLAPGLADMTNLNATPGRGQCVFKSTIENVMWRLNLVGKSTLGAAIDIKDCDARSGRWVDAPGSLYMHSYLCKASGNFRIIVNPRQADTIFRNQGNNF